MSRVSIDRIKAVVAADYDVRVGDLLADRRDRIFVSPRHVAIYFACELTPLSRTAIGRLFGGRDHSTIYSAHQKIGALRLSDVFLDGRLRRLQRELLPTPEKQPTEVQLCLFIGPLFDGPAPAPAFAEPVRHLELAA